MPFYVYRCLKCKKHLEIQQKIIDNRIEYCGQYCEEPYSESTGPLNGPVKIVLQPIHTIFKGSGFYENDYKRKNNKK